MLTRKEGWEKVLAGHIEESLRKPQAWGTVDCCLFACDWILKATGVDPAAEFRGKYDTQAGAYRLMKKYANGLYGTAEKIFTELEMPETIPTLARRGDIALVPGNGGPALGIVDTSGMRIAVHGKDGLAFVPVNQSIKVWRVG